MSSIGFYEFQKDYGFWGKKNYHKKFVVSQSCKELITVTHSFYRYKKYWEWKKTKNTYWKDRNKLNEYTKPNL